MRCRFCGYEIEAGVRFCPECGLEIEKKEIDRLNAELKQDARKSFKKFAIIGVAVVVVYALIFGGEEAKEQSGQVEEKSWINDIWENQRREDSEHVEEKIYDVTEGGIHSYQCVLDDCSWEEAYRKCLEWGGHLVRINSQEEYDYIISIIEDAALQNVIFRLGARRDLDSTEYYWVDENDICYGESLNDDEYWSISQWKSGEPNFYDGDIEETCVEMYYNSDENRWVWNDIPNDLIAIAPYYSGRVGYIVEYE